MNDSPQTFSYTAQRTSYLTTAGALLFLMGIESSVVALLVIVLIHIVVLKFVLLLALICFLTFVVTRLFAPLRTKHALSDTQLSLHYGAAFKATIPRQDIIDSQAIREQATMFGPMSAQFDAKKQRIVASFSEQGQVLLRLNKPHTFKVNGKTVLTDTLLINVDKRDEFLQALGMSDNRKELKTGRDRCITSSPALQSPTGRES